MNERKRARTWPVRTTRHPGHTAAPSDTSGTAHVQKPTTRDHAAGIPAPHPEPRRDLRPNRPASARLASLMLAGKDHLPADRILLHQLQAEDAGCAETVRRAREFLHHTVRLQAERGLGQFLDLGCGLTTGAPGTVLAPIHTSILTVRPGARVTYLDRDAVVMTHARALLDAPKPARIRHLHADLASPRTLLAMLRLSADLDWRRPVVAVLGDVLHELSDPQARSLLRALHTELPADSVLVLTHRTADATAPVRAVRVAACWARAGLPWHPRAPAAVDALLGGWERQELGVQPATGAGTPSLYAVVAVRGGGSTR
ncbi:SAM-dependent methyltransferase [Streptomyces sp. BE20]|uniref:SAM-dependent methyltransferase n=1 Tax=Streptomyces sp. BE20 TaxID=3002525 RepID=UPI002E7A37FC|nr:SAM-dependent methyltransferase [Streptomyces sp. BE20]MEE1820854.1 SAM-dependent methyltransferase [Streptomyces sp. BE20]